MSKPMLCSRGRTIECIGNDRAEVLGDAAKDLLIDLDQFLAQE
ncbi:hypothetical protein ACVIWV_009195 [Bradyrhizobium diazoefficiens]|jgi:hypothetical protein|nr:MULTISPECIES: hypothetical protein [Bradyrhizobium]WLA55924.1 hypothetical protein QIH81_36255 [Bradyrhizobium diazoefficiens]